ncbi:MAG: response regulator [Chloroflexales bacterium]|nr:response regulator [Chloroflexales bacterium]
MNNPSTIPNQLQCPSLSPIDGSAATLAYTQKLLDAVNAMTSVALQYHRQPERFMEEMISCLIKIMNFQAGALFISEKQPGALCLAAVATAPGQKPTTEQSALWRAPLLDHTQKLAQQTIDQGQAFIITADLIPPHLKPIGAALQNQAADRLISMPLLVEQRPIGVVQTVVPIQHSFAQTEVLAMQLLAGQIAVTIERLWSFMALRAEQERTRAVVDATNDAILMLDATRRVIMINRRAKFFFGLAERDVWGKEYHQLYILLTLILDEPQRFTQWFLPLLESETKRDMEEFQALLPEPRLLQCFTAPVVGHDEQYLGRILIFRDITREREVERMKNDFISIVSHELRTPLTSIRGSLQLVLGRKSMETKPQSLTLPPRSLELLNVSLSNTERLIRLINDILDISKIEQGRIQLQPDTLDPANVCQAACNEVAAFATTRGITVQIETPEELPSICADRDRTVQILINLISNAIKFSESGQQVLLSAQPFDKFVRFSVRDWGRGIAPEDQQRIFQKFQQLDSSTTRNAGGTGLGLAICKALVEEHGGRIWLEDAMPHGTVFHFTLPLAVDHADQADIPRQLKRQTLVLVVDDDPHVRPLLARLLEKHGFHVASAANGVEALEFVRRKQPDLILLDIKMPDIDGFEVLRRLKHMNHIHPIPVVILTANDLGEITRTRALRLGAFVYLEKPIASEHLISTIEQVLDQVENPAITPG